MSKDVSSTLLPALRDFFMAQNAAELAAAYGQLGGPAVADWTVVEFAFNRLFVGPRALLAPPFASIYLEPEPQLMGRSTQTVRHLYEMMGLTSPWHNRLPDDHLSLELDAYLQLQTVLNRLESAELTALRDYFLLKHLHQWLPRFIQRVKTTAVTPAPILFAVDQLAVWLQAEVARVQETNEKGNKVDR